MRVRQRDQNVFLSDCRRGMNRAANCVHFFRIENAVVERDDHLRLTGRRRVRLNPQQRGLQRTMDSGGPVMQGSAPHPMVNADRRGDLAPRDGGPAAGLRCVNDGDLLHLRLRRVCLLDSKAPNTRQQGP